LTSARAGIVEDRITYLCELARGKRILDVGMDTSLMLVLPNVGFTEGCARSHKNASEWIY
jgi:hypothetical protein